MRNTKNLLQKHVQIIAKIELYKTWKLGIWKHNSSSPVLYPKETKWELHSAHFVVVTCDEMGVALLPFRGELQLKGHVL